MSSRILKSNLIKTTTCLVLGLMVPAIVVDGVTCGQEAVIASTNSSISTANTSNCENNPPSCTITQYFAGSQCAKSSKKYAYCDMTDAEGHQQFVQGELMIWGGTCWYDMTHKVWACMQPPPGTPPEYDGLGPCPEAVDYGYDAELCPENS